MTQTIYDPTPKSQPLKLEECFYMLSEHQSDLKLWRRARHLGYIGPQVSPSDFQRLLMKAMMHASE